MANDRLTQLPVEPVVSPTSGKARTSQLPAEAVVSPTSGQARSSQVVSEAVVSPTSGKARTSQVVVEVVIQVASLDFKLDAVVKGTRTGSFTLDSSFAFIYGGQFSLDAIIPGSASGSFTLDAVFSTGFLRLDAVVKGTQSAGFALSAWIYSPRADPGGPGEPGETPLVSIIVDGEDITEDVILADATFTMLVNGAVGTCKLRVRDLDYTHSFASGSEITVDIDGRRKFGGYITQPKRMFAFPVDDMSTNSAERFHVLEGVDYNILMTKRVLYNKDDPKRVELRSWAAGTRDDIIIRYVFDNYTDLPADGVTYQGVQHVGFPNPDHTGVVGSGGLRFVDAMREINRLISGVFYIDPYKDLNYVDVDEPDAEFGLSDDPTVGQVGYRDFEFSENGAKLANDALLWGAGLGARRMVFNRTQDAPSIAAHGRWQYGEFTTSIFRQASLDLRAETVVFGTPQSKRGGKDNQESWLATTFEPSFTAGQKVEIESIVHGIDDVVPIRRMTLTFPTQRSVKQILTLSHEIDEPWNIFEFWFPGFPPFPPFPPIEFPPVLPPLICGPDAFILGSSGGDFACIIPGDPPGQNGCTTITGPTSGDLVNLYTGAVYQVEYVVDFAGAYALGGAIAATGGAPLWGQVNFGYFFDHGTIYQSEEFEVSPDAAPGQGGLYGLLLSATPHSNHIHVGASLSARVRYVSGPDPRFENFECVDTTVGFLGTGSSQIGLFGDGIQTVFQLISAYHPGSTRVFVGGFFQRPGIEYTESDPNAGEITFTSPPADDASIVVLFEAFGSPF